MKLTDKIWCLGNRHFNMFIVGKKRAVIVECGVSGAVANLRQQWPYLQPQPEITHLLAMHAHFDHICGIPNLCKLFPQAQVAASAIGSKVMEKDKVMTGFFAQDKEMINVLDKQGILNDVADGADPQTIKTQVVLNDGDILTVEKGCTLKMVSAPGHSPCSMAAYMPEEKVLFTSDACGFQISDEEIFPIFFQGYEMYVDSIRSLRGYPADILAIPHERIWKGAEEIAAFYDRALKAAQQAYDSIRQMSETGVAVEDMKKILFDRYYKGNLRIYTKGNIKLCVSLLIKRVQECL